MVIPLGILRIRQIQRWFNYFHLHPRKDRKMKLLVTQPCIRALLHWRDKDFLRRGSPLGTGQSSSQKISDNDRCITDRVGSHLGGQVRKWNMGPPLVIRTHKCAQTEGCTFGSQGSAAVFTPQTCASKNRQYLRSLLRKSPGWDEINTLPPSGNRSADMGMATPVYIPGVANRATKILARVGPLPGESRLHTVVVAQI